jgi:hypothetical protein
MKRIHTKFNSFKMFESISQFMLIWYANISTKEIKDRILGVFGTDDYYDYVDTATEIYYERGTMCDLSPDIWENIMKKGNVMVLYDIDPETSNPNKYRHPNAVIGILTTDNKGQILTLGDNLDGDIYVHQVGRPFPGSFDPMELKSSYIGEKIGGSTIHHKIITTYAKLWPVLSAYDKLKRKGDLSMTDTTLMLVGEGDDLTSYGLMTNAKESIEKTQKVYPSLMSALRTVYPEDYYKVFPDEDISADMGDLGF